MPEPTPIAPTAQLDICRLSDPEGQTPQSSLDEIFIPQDVYDTDPLRAIQEYSGINKALYLERIQHVDFTNPDEVEKLFEFFPEAKNADQKTLQKAAEGWKELKNELLKTTFEEFIVRYFTENRGNYFERLILPSLKKTANNFFEKHPDVEAQIRKDSLSHVEAAEIPAIEQIIAEYFDPDVILGVIQRAMEKIDPSPKTEDGHDITGHDSELVNEFKTSLIEHAFSNLRAGLSLAELGKSDRVCFYWKPLEDGSTTVIRVTAHTWSSDERSNIVIRFKDKDAPEQLHQIIMKFIQIRQGTGPLAPKGYKPQVDEETIDPNALGLGKIIDI